MCCKVGIDSTFLSRNIDMTCWSPSQASFSLVGTRDDCTKRINKLSWLVGKDENDTIIALEGEQKLYLVKRNRVISTSSWCSKPMRRCSKLLQLGKSSVEADSQIRPSVTMAQPLCLS